MTRREVVGALCVLLAAVLGRGLRRWLLCDAHGAWREPGWLEDRLPPLAAEPEEPAVTGPPPILNPNTCPADSLVLLPGIGPALADRIVAARAGGLHFACARDLQVVRGIGPRTAARLSPYLEFPDKDTDGSERSATPRQGSSTR